MVDIKLIINLYDNHKKIVEIIIITVLSLLHFVRLAIQYALANNFLFVFIYLGKSSGDENGARWVLFNVKKTFFSDLLINALLICLKE